MLDVVDAVIAELGPRAMGLSVLPPKHRAHHESRAGQVELWEPFAVEDSDDDSDENEERWISLRDRRYADFLAERIHEMVEEAPVLASTGRPLVPGDVLVLVRSRGELASLIVARLFSSGVAVAGVDRLHLNEPLAVQDLLAATRFAVQPDDDLSLACLLVSPLIGWDQDRLRELAYGRSGSLWRELGLKANSNSEFRAARDALGSILAMADYATPSRFLEAILSGPLQGRSKLYGRLGRASRDAIDELMNTAFDFEQSETASLDRFLAWFSRDTVDVQRDPGQPANEVRVMTVHGAKGLEAPVVILADATADPARLGRAPVTLDFEMTSGAATPLLRPRKDERCPPFDELIAAEEQRDLEEHWRLLYVALTRAADRLIVSGVAPKQKKDGVDPRPTNCWHRAVEQAMLAQGVAIAERSKWGSALVYGSGRAAKARRTRARIELPAVIVPDWAKRAVPMEPRPPRPLAPSTIASDNEASAPPSEAMRSAALRGTWIHQLFERLAEVPPADRYDRALEWLERSCGLTDLPQRREIVNQVCAVLSDIRFASLFGTGSLGEAPLAATLPDGRVIAGTVDRLLIEANQVSVLDFKTGRVPATEAEIPASHRAQMSAYIEALRVIFPERNIRGSLLYTAGPKLFEQAS